MRCCLRSAELEELEAECLGYQRRAVAACGQPLDMSDFFQRVKEEEQQALLEAVQVAHRASLQRLKCEYCDTREDIQTLDVCVTVHRI